MRQFGLIPSGCQVRGLNVVCSTNDHIFYASTLAIYILDSKTFNIIKILSNSEKPICSISASPHKDNLLASVEYDGTLTCWNYDTQEIVASSRQGPKKASIACFNPFQPRECLIIQSVDQIYAYLWKVDEPIKDVLYQITQSHIHATCAQWNHQLQSVFAVGTSTGAVIIYNKDTKSRKFLQKKK